MKNFVESGDQVTVAAPYDVASGAGALVGTALFGVAADAAANGASVVLRTTGVFDLAKAAGDTFTVGARVYWNNSNKNCTSTSTGNTDIGVATAAAATGDATVRVKIPKTI